jgi:hypothetical protein
MEFLLVFGIGMFILGAIYVALALLGRQEQNVGDWPTVTGEVVDTSLYRKERRFPGFTRVTYTPTITYRYMVDGVTYTSQNLDFAPPERSSYENAVEAEAVLKEYAVDTDVTVHYNPRAPRQAVLEVEKPQGYYTGLVSGLFNVGMGLLTVVVYFLFR